MNDRVVEFPHRYRDKLTGQILDLEPMPGEISDEGTLLNKASLLSDETAEIFGLAGEEATVDNALRGTLGLESYMAFVGNVNQQQVDAAFGYNNEDEVTGVGRAISLYARYADGISIDNTKNVSKCGNLHSLNLSVEALQELLQSPKTLELMGNSGYCRTEINNQYGILLAPNSIEIAQVAYDGKYNYPSASEISLTTPIGGYIKPAVRYETHGNNSNEGTATITLFNGDVEIERKDVGISNFTSTTVYLDKVYVNHGDTLKVVLVTSGAVGRHAKILSFVAYANFNKSVELFTNVLAKELTQANNSFTVAKEGVYKLSACCKKHYASSGGDTFTVTMFKNGIDKVLFYSQFVGKYQGALVDYSVEAVLKEGDVITLGEDSVYGTIEFIE